LECFLRHLQVELGIFFRTKLEKQLIGLAKYSPQLLRNPRLFPQPFVGRLFSSPLPLSFRLAALFRSMIGMRLRDSRKGFERCVLLQEA
jgi:hypothetical protein